MENCFIDYLYTLLHRRKILSHFLLATYMLVAIQSSVSHAHNSDTSESPVSIPHQHDGFTVNHHDYHFHIGIFHFFGHILEKVNHSDNIPDEYVIVSQDTPTKIDIEKGIVDLALIDQHSLYAYNPDVESLSDPPFLLFQLQRYKHPDTPLRGPPSCV